MKRSVALFSLLFAIMTFKVISQTTTNEVDTVAPEVTVIDTSSPSTVQSTTIAVTLPSFPGFSSITSLYQATIFCRSLNQVGRYPVLNSTTQLYISKGYYNCYFYNGAIFGQYYTCPGATIFNSTTQICGRENYLTV